MKNGLIHVYTGNGKGKTTSAVGLSVRAKSRGLRVLFAQFMKKISGGEPVLLKELGIDVLRFEKVLSPFFNPKADRKAIRKEALRALETLKPMLGEYDIVVLDEFTHLIATGLVSDDEAKEFIMSKPAQLELVLTGRDAPDWLLQTAEHVTEMKDIKHPARKGVRARKGIEF